METPFGTTQYEYDLMDRIVRVVAHDGTTSAILGSEIEVLAEPVIVYNLEVEDLIRYI